MIHFVVRRVHRNCPRII